MLFKALPVLLILVASLQAATFTVSKDGRGAFTTIQSAIDRASRNDIVEILDAAVYLEQVTIDSSKNGLILRSANPSSLQKPIIRYQDVLNQGPKTCQEGLDPAKITYDQNGALRLFEVENVTLEGLEVDGIGSAPFEWPAVWGNGLDCNGQLQALFHGNTGLVLLHSARVTVRECNFRNAFFGVDVNDRNPTGAFIAPFPDFEPTPSARPGFHGTGGHLFENCLFAGNVIGVAGRRLQGLPSTFRNNHFYANGHATHDAARAVNRLYDGRHHIGGAVFLRESPFCPWFFEQNTFASNYLIFNAHHMPNGNHVLHANLFGSPSRYWAVDSVFPNPFQELFPSLWNGQRRNIVAAQTEAPRAESRAVRFSARDSVSGEVVRYDTLVEYWQNIRIMNGFPQPEQVSDTLHKDLLLGGRVLPSKEVVHRVLPFAAIVDMQGDIEASRKRANRWWEARFASLDPAISAFLEPIWPSSLPADLRPTAVEYRNRYNVAALPGRIPKADQAPTLLRVTPLAPVLEVGNDLELLFEVTTREGANGSSIGIIAVAGLVPVESAPFSWTSFGGVTPPPQAIHRSVLPSTPLQFGFNRIRIPRPWTSGKLGMVHLLLRAQNSQGGIGFSEWTSFPAGMIRQDIRVMVNGDSGTGPIDAPPDGRITVTLAGLPVTTTPLRLRLQRLSGLPLVYTDSSLLDSGWLVEHSRPIEVRLTGDPASLKYDALLAYNVPITVFGPPDLSGVSALFRFPGAVVGTKSHQRKSKSIRAPLMRDALGRQLPPSRIRPSPAPAFTTPQKDQGAAVY